ncbi:MAG TPA: ABC transporter ATP-binding protein [Candidatus Dormibacteraeota bacterium]|nr:ABC transporter ATP-binding protein [Candidatus Dormibacteraeota bacterium]
MSVIRLDHVGRRYGGRVAVGDLSLDVGDGEIVVLVGPSGCGKTTTLRMVNRLVEPTSGTITIDGRDTRSVDATTLRRGIGYVIQQVGLFPHLTVAENVATVPRLLGWDRARIRERVDELLDLVGLPAAEYARLLPGELSGGQRQRVGVARALGADPPVLLMDEPFGAIDPVTRLRLQEELLRLQGVVRKTIVFVTHDIDEAIRLGDRIALLDVGGRLAQLDTPERLLAAPAEPFVEEFLGGGRLVRRLALVPLRSVTLAAVDGRVPTARVDIGATLRDALDEVLRADGGAVAVYDGERVAGVVDADVIRAASR